MIEANEDTISEAEAKSILDLLKEQNLQQGTLFREIVAEFAIQRFVLVTLLIDRYSTLPNATRQMRAFQQRASLTLSEGLAARPEQQHYIEQAIQAFFDQVIAGLPESGGALTEPDNQLVN